MLEFMWDCVVLSIKAGIGGLLLGLASLILGAPFFLFFQYLKDYTEIRTFDKGFGRWDK
jgi:hypothetical protein